MPQSTIWIYDNERFASEPTAFAALWKSEDGPDLSNQIMIDCEMKKQITFENSDEYLPLTRPGYNYLECSFYCDEDSCEFENEQGIGQSRFCTNF